MTTVVTTTIDTTTIQTSNQTQPESKTKSLSTDIKDDNTNNPNVNDNDLPSKQPQPPPNDHTTKSSSLLDLDYKPTKNKHQKSSDQQRKSSLSTESVEVYIYRRTSLVTSSGIYKHILTLFPTTKHIEISINFDITKTKQNEGGSLMQINDDQNKGHQRMETGMNLWDTPPTKIHNYQLQEMNNNNISSPEQQHDIEQEELYIVNNDIDLNNDNNIQYQQEIDDEGEEEDMIAPISSHNISSKHHIQSTSNSNSNSNNLGPMESIPYDQTKSRDSLSVDEQFEKQKQEQFKQESDNLQQSPSMTGQSTGDEDNLAATVITRKSSYKTLVYHESEDDEEGNEYSQSKDISTTNDDIHHQIQSEDDEKLIKEIRTNNDIVSGYLVMKENINKRHGTGTRGGLEMEQVNVMNLTPSGHEQQVQPKMNMNNSSILEMIGSPVIDNNYTINHIVPQSQSKQLSQNDLDEQFFIEINKQRLSQKSTSSKKNTQRFSNISKRDSTNETRDYLGGRVDENEEEEGDEEIPRQRVLTRENLMVHDYKNDLQDIKQDIDDIIEAKSIRYIAITNDDDHDMMKGRRGKGKINNEELELQQARYHEIDSEIKGKRVKPYSYKKRVQYITMIGAVCCVTVLIGYVYYSRSNGGNTVRITRGTRMNNGNSSNLMLPPRAKRRAPRIG